MLAEFLGTLPSVFSFHSLVFPTDTWCNIVCNICCNPCQMTQFVAQNVAEVENDSTSKTLPAILCTILNLVSHLKAVSHMLRFLVQFVLQKNYCKLQTPCQMSDFDCNFSHEKNYCKLHTQFESTVIKWLACGCSLIANYTTMSHINFYKNCCRKYTMISRAACLIKKTVEGCRDHVKDLTSHTCVTRALRSFKHASVVLCCCLCNIDWI